MPATKTELKTKDEFHGDLLDRQFSVRHDPKTGLYSYDYAELSPEIKTELDKIQFYRFSSPKLAEVEAEVAKLQKPSGVPPPPPPVSPVKGAITAASEATAEGYQKTYNAWAKIYDKEAAGGILTAEEARNKAELQKSLVVYIRQGMAQEAKKILNSIENIRNEGIANANLSANQRKLMAKEEEMKQIIDAYEVIESLEDKIKAKTLSEEDLRRLDEAETTLNRVPVMPPEIDLILQGYFQRKLYNSARAIKTQIEGTPETERTANQTRNYTKALANINAYETANPNAKRAREEKERSIVRALTPSVSPTRYREAKAKLNALNRKLNRGLTLTEEEQEQQRQASANIDQYERNNPNTNNNTNNNTNAPPSGPTQEQFDTALRRYQELDDAANGRNLTEDEERERAEARAVIDEFEKLHPNLSGGRRKRKTKKAKKSKRKSKKTRKH